MKENALIMQLKVYVYKKTQTC